MKSRLTIAPRTVPNKAAIWLALIAGTTMAAGVIAVWYVIDHRAHEHAGLATDNAIRMHQLLIRQDTDNRLAALDRLAHRWTAAGGKSRPEWEADAARYIEDMPGFELIQWIDSAMQARWTVVSDEAEAATSAGFIGSEQVQSAMKEARRSGKIVVAEPFGIAPDGLCIGVFLPVSRGQNFDGFIVGVLSLDRWLDAVIGNFRGTDHHIRILLNGQEVYRFDVENDAPDDSRTERGAFESHGLNWEVLVTPTSSFLSAGHADSSTLVLIVGLLFSLLVSLAVYLALAARQRSRQFRDMATQLATLFKNLPGMAYRRGNEPNSRLEFVSEGCRGLSGYPRSDFDEVNKYWVDIIHPEDRARVTSDVAEAIREGDAFELEYRIVDRSGSERWVWERGRLIDSGSDGQAHVEGFITDVTDRKRAENEARQHRENLAHVDRLNMLGEMATGIAHEINQPLTAISLFVQAGSRLVAGNNQDRLPEIFEKLINHAHRASVVIERMQNMARGRESAKEVISCRALIEEVAKLAEAEARIRDMTIVVDVDERLPDVSVDTVQIQQVVLNLLRNGMESMQSDDRQDGNAIGLEARQAAGSSIEVSVIDHGSGVSEAIADTIFAPFSTSKKSGMGMGLSISRAIVTAHGGRLDFKNNDAGGATFYFTLPPADAEDQNDR